jgi:hypothetical protein
MNPMKIFATAISLTLGNWRLRIAIDLDDETFAPERTTATSRYNCSESPRQRISTHRS